MRIGLLQFNPKLGAVDHNVNKITDLLRRRCKKKPLDLLVLPEMAITGYAFQSTEHIAPYLETHHGRSFQLATELCQNGFSKMTVLGYPEIGTDGRSYNSGMLVDQHRALYHFRKKHLFVTDETWAEEGQAFGHLKMKNSATSLVVNMAFGICMDINPRKCKLNFSS
jgi:protein N-terminal amidase